MSRVILVVSDFHLGNGRFLPDGTVNALEDFVYDERFIEFLEHHDQQQGAEPLELVINGDFMNMIQLLPEELPLGILTERAAVHKTEAIISGHRDLFQALKRFNAKPNRRVVYIMGNHDPGVLWPGVQEVLRRTIQGDLEFVDTAYRTDGVHIEHGHQLEPIFRFDPQQYFLTRGFKEPVLNMPWGIFFVTEFLYRVKRRRPYIDKVKPYSLYTRWATFYDFWFGLFSVISYLFFIVRSRFSRLPLKSSQAFYGLRAFRELKRSPTLAEQAYEILKKHGGKIIILGHTHIPIHRRLDAEREYLNPGCWNDVTSLDLSTLGHSRRLIYVRVDFRDGRPLARLQEWHGQPKLFEEVRA